MVQIDLSEIKSKSSSNYSELVMVYVDPMLNQIVVITSVVKDKVKQHDKDIVGEVVVSAGKRALKMDVDVAGEEDEH